jgi:cytochrome c peroxidase
MHHRYFYYRYFHYRFFDPRRVDQFARCVRVLGSDLRVRYARTKVTVKPTLSCVLAFSLTACGEFTPAPVEFSQDDIVSVGDLHTIEIQGRVIASLPQNPPPVDEKQAELGRLLFWDPILSGDQDVACGTCHLPELAYTDGQSQAIGVDGTGRGELRVAGHTGMVRRNTQTLVNTAWNGIGELGVFDPATAPMFWDNRAAGFAEQAIEPIESREEMRGDLFTKASIQQEIEQRLAANAQYPTLFQEAFGTTVPTMDLVTSALASFQTTLVANNTRFDQWMRGDNTAMSPREQSGMQEFVIAGCADCHSGPMFSDFEPHVLGVREGPFVTEPDNGDGNFAFRTPTLRQLEFTAPYFHAGQFATLQRAIDFYDQPRSSENPNVPSSSLDEELLDVPEMDDGRGPLIISFLNTLNDENFDHSIPTEVPSGLPPGGF